MNKGEVWFVEFPLEEDESKSINRPVVVLDENILGVLSVKITKHKARKEDPYDTPIIYWEEAGLRLASTARVSKVTLLTKDSFIFKIGDLHHEDLKKIEEMDGNDPEVFAAVLTESVQKSLEKNSYGKTVTVKVSVEKDNSGKYGLSDTEMNKMEAAMFPTE